MAVLCRVGIRVATDTTSREQLNILASALVEYFLGSLARSAFIFSSSSGDSLACSAGGLRCSKGGRGVSAAVAAEGAGRSNGDAGAVVNDIGDGAEGGGL